MPLPKPNEGESKKDWDDRCMSDDAMVKEYPDNDQRYAVCNSIWEKAKRSEESKEPIIDRRALSFEESEIRAVKNDKGKTMIVGYFALFNKLSENLGGFREKIAPGAFKEALKGSDVVDLFNHDPNFILGRESSGTLRLWEDERGLRYEVDIPETQLIKDLVISPIERKDLKGNSFGFTIPWDDEDYYRWDGKKDGLPVGILVKVERLLDGSQVTFPAYPQTKLALRSLRKWEASQKNGAGSIVMPSHSIELEDGGTISPKAYDPEKRKEEMLEEFRSFFGKK